jgi:sec-independent protein translocase protein TatB
MSDAASTGRELSLMFDISWSEFLLIGIVALIVIGPKELPAVMRTLGQWTRKVRSMATEFQNQFQEAMREAEMADLKKQVDDMAHDVTDIDPLKGVREDVENVGTDVQRSLSSTTEQPAVSPAEATEPALPAPAAASPDAATALSSEPAAAVPAAAPGGEPAAPQHAAEEPHGAPDAEPAGATRTG